MSAVQGSAAPAAALNQGCIGCAKLVRHAQLQGASILLAPSGFEGGTCPFNRAAGFAHVRIAHGSGADFEVQDSARRWHLTTVFEQPMIDRRLRAGRQGRAAVACHWRAPAARLPTLCCLPGLGADFSSFEPLLARAELTGFGILGIDFPISAGSCTETVTVQELTSALLETAEAVDARSLVLVGHSFGGLVGLQAIAAGLRSDGFVNIEGNLTGEDCGYVSRASARASLSEFRARIFPRLRRAFATGKRAGDRFYAAAMDSVDPVQFHAYCKEIVALSDSGSLLSAFADYPGAKLHIRGSDSQPAGYIGKIAGCEFVEVADAGHFCFLDNPGAVATAIRRFLESRQIGMECL